VVCGLSGDDGRDADVPQKAPGLGRLGRAPCRLFPGVSASGARHCGSGLRLRIKRGNVGQPFETERITITPEELEADITFFKTTQKKLGDFFLKLFPEFGS
jgi:hypothetical protein